MIKIELSFTNDKEVEDFARVFEVGVKQVGFQAFAMGHNVLSTIINQAQAQDENLSIGEEDSQSDTGE